MLDVRFTNIVSQSLTYLFIVVWTFEEESLILMMFNLSIFSLIDFIFGIKFKKPLPRPNLEDFLL